MTFSSSSFCHPIESGLGPQIPECGCGFVLHDAGDELLTRQLCPEIWRGKAESEKLKIEIGGNAGIEVRFHFARRWWGSVNAARLSGVSQPGRQGLEEKQTFDESDEAIDEKSFNWPQKGAKNAKNEENTELAVVGPREKSPVCVGGARHGAPTTSAGCWWLFPGTAKCRNYRNVGGDVICKQLKWNGICE